VVELRARALSQLAHPNLLNEYLPSEGLIRRSIKVENLNAESKPSFARTSLDLGPSLVPLCGFPPSRFQKRRNIATARLRPLHL
jgi:hypothetical protein